MALNTFRRGLNMHKRLGGIVAKMLLSALAFVLALGIVMIPGKNVKADENDMGEIKDGQLIRVYWDDTDPVYVFKFTVDTPGKYAFFTSSSSDDSYVDVYDSSNTCIAGNDDAGYLYDAYVLKDLEKGTYTIKVGTAGTCNSNDTVVGVVRDDGSSVSIIPEVFPDDVFRENVVRQYDYNSDGKLSGPEFAASCYMSCYGMNIENITGIEKFTNLMSLNFGNNSLTSVDLSKNTKIRYIYLYSSTGIKSLNLSGCNDLEYLDCSYCTNLKSLDVSNKTKLRSLYCYNSAIGTLNVSGCTSLNDLYCESNELKTLDVKTCKKLREFDCSYNNLKSLDVSGLEHLVELYCYDNRITTLNCGGCTQLDLVEADYNHIQNADFSKCKYLRYLEIDGNQLETLDLSSCKNLTYLDCYSNNLTSLDISGCPRLYYVSAKLNDLTDLDVSGCPILSEVYDETNWDSSDKYYYSYIQGYDAYLKIDLDVKVKKAAETYIDINETNFPDAAFRSYLLSSGYDQDSDGKFSKKEILMIKDIDIPSAGITKLDGIEFFTELEYLGCSSNSLTNLDVSKNTKLQVLSCAENQIASLDLSNNSYLVRLYCMYNKLTSLDISNNEDLTSLGCHGNNIKELDLSDNPKLAAVYKNPFATNETTDAKEYSSEDGDVYLSLDKKQVVRTEKPTPTPTATPTPKPTATAAPTAAPTAKPVEVNLTLDKNVLSIVCGKSGSLKATLTGATGTIAWATSDKKIATVDGSGKITTKQAGTVTITATAAGKSASCVVTVLYKDVTKTKDFWFAPTNYLTAKNVVKGYDNQTKFKPANDCTRAQMVTFLWRLAGEPKPKATTTKFKDVKKSAYYYKPVIWAVEKGITTGVSKTKFNPSGVCTRAQTVTFLWRMANKPAPKTSKNPFKDVKKKDYFYKAVLWASEKKIVAGYKDGTFKPQGKCLRRQMVTFLYKYDKYVNGKG